MSIVSYYFDTYFSIWKYKCANMMVYWDIATQSILRTLNKSTGLSKWKHAL